MLLFMDLGKIPNHMELNYTQMSRIHYLLKIFLRLILIQIYTGPTRFIWILEMWVGNHQLMRFFCWIVMGWMCFILENHWLIKWLVVFLIFTSFRVLHHWMLLISILAWLEGQLLCLTGLSVYFFFSLFSKFLFCFYFYFK